MITIYAKDATALYTNGLGVLLPDSCKLTEEANGLYELELTHPMDDEERYTLIAAECILKVPVPKRYTPFVDLHEVTSTITYTVSTAGPLYAHNAFTSPALEWLAVGDTVVLLEAGDPYYLVAAASGETGFVLATSLTYDDEAASVPDESLQTFRTRNQLFRIYRVEKDTTAGKVSVWARHIFYDLGWHGLRVCDISTLTPAQDALTAIDGYIRPWHTFDFYTNSTWKVKRDWSRRNAVEVILDPDEGFVHYRTPGLYCVRDNYNVFLMRAGGRSRNDPLMHGKNLLGVKSEVSYENLYNRIHPIGQDVNGNPLYTASPTYIDSPDLASGDIIRTKIIEYSDVKVGDEDDDEVVYTVASARTELEARALAEFTAGMDKPEYNLSVNFVLLGDTAEYAAYKDLDRVYLYDTIDVIDTLHGINVRAAVTAYEWDVLNARYNSITLGKTYGQAAARVISGYQLRARSIPGVKLAPQGIQAQEIHNISTDVSDAGTVILQGGSFTVEAADDTDMTLSDEGLRVNGPSVEFLTDSLTVATVNAEKMMLQVAVNESDETEVHVGADLLTATNIKGDVVNTYSGTALEWAGTIQGSIDNLPKYLMGEVGLTVPAGTYNEDVSIIGIKGQKLTLALADGVVLAGSLLISGCDQVRVYSATLGYGKISKNIATLVTVMYSNVEFYRMTFTGGAATNIGLLADFSRVSLYQCEFNKCGTYCAQFRNTTKGYMYQGIGGGTGKTNGGYAVRVELGADATLVGTVPTATSGRTSVGATGGIITEIGAVTGSGGTISDPTLATTYTYTATATRRLYVRQRRSGTRTTSTGAYYWIVDWSTTLSGSWATAIPRQGALEYRVITLASGAGTYSNVAQDRDLYYSCWIFGSFAVAGKTIQTAKLSIRRSPDFGRTGAVTLRLYYHNYTTAPTGSSYAALTYAGQTVSLTPGQTGTITLNATNLALLNDGSIKGFGLAYDGTGLLLAGDAAAKIEMTYA